MITRQLFWLGMGLSVGALGYRKAARAAEALHPEHVAHSMADACLELAYSMREFLDDVRIGMEHHAAGAELPALR